MKILQVVHGFVPYAIAGTEVYTYNLSKELSKDNEVFIFFRINEPDKEEYFLSHKHNEGIESYSINHSFRGASSFENAYINENIDRVFGAILDKIRPDIVHIQHLMFLSSGIVSEIKKRNIPIIFTLHDYWLICPQGQLLRNNYEVCGGRENSNCVDCIPYQLYIKKHVFNYFYFIKKNLPNPILQLFRKIYINYAKVFVLKKKDVSVQLEKRAIYMQKVISMVDLFIAPSQFLRKKFIEFGVPETKIIFSRYGFNIGDFNAIKKESSKKLRLAFIGNIIPAKGLHVLIQAFNMIKEDNVELRIYGKAISYKGAIDGYLHKIKKSVRNKNVHFMGGFDNKEVGRIFREIDILIVPSVWYENSPLVIQEALLSGVSVVASDIGGIPELIKDGVNGLLFGSNNIDQLRERLEYIIENQEYQSRFAKVASEVKSIEDNAKEIERIYHTLVTKKNEI